MALGSKQYQYRILKVRIGIVVLFVVCVLLALSVWERYTVEREMFARREAAETELAALAERYEALELEVDYLRDERSMEAEIRKRFDVAREGESVVILTGERSTAVSTTTPIVVVEQSRWWQFWR